MKHKVLRGVGIAVAVIVSVIIIVLVLRGSSLFDRERYTAPVAQTEVPQQPVVQCSDFATNSDVFTAAVEAEDLTICGCVKDDDTFAQTCEDSVADLRFYTQAVDQFNPALCTEIKDATKQAACTRIASSGTQYVGQEDPAQLAYTLIYNNAPRAVEELEKVVAQNANDADVLAALAVAYAEQGLRTQEQGGDQTPSVQKALEVIEQAKAVDPNSAEVFRSEGFAYEILPDYVKAAESYEKALEIDDQNVLAYVGRGHLFDLLGDPESALADFQKADSLDPKNEETVVYTNLCRLQASRDDLQSDAVRHCTIVANDENAGAQRQSDAHQILGRIYIGQKEFDKANAQFLSAKTLTPNDPNLFVGWAELSIAREDFVRAEQDARKAISLSPTKAASHQALAYALYQQERSTEAIAAAEKTLELIDADVSLLASNKDGFRRDAYYTLANIYHFTGDTEKENEYKQKGDAVFSSNQQ